jgi:hypothetical protein
VQDSLFQAPVSLYQDNRSRLAPLVVQLYLHISIMLLTTGQTHHVALANMLELLFGLIPIDNQEWPAVPFWFSVSCFEPNEPIFVGFNASGTNLFHAR